MHYCIDMRAHDALALLLQGAPLQPLIPLHPHASIPFCLPSDSRVDVTCADRLGRSAAHLAVEMGDHDAQRLLQARACCC